MRNVIFLDVDGVLNSSSTREKTPLNYIGIDDSKLLVIKEIQKMLKAEIVLSSDWKDFFSDDLTPMDKDAQYLIDKLANFEMVISDKTTDGHNMHDLRGLGIVNYLSDHKDIDKYIIIDDNKFDFEEYEETYLHTIITMNGILTCYPLAQSKAAQETKDAVKLIKLIRRGVYNLTKANIPCDKK